jgi:hypothetical protein
VQGLVQEEGRDAQTGFFPQVHLDGIGGDCCGPRAGVLAGAAETADTVRQARPGGLVQLHRFVGQDVGLHLEDGHLGDLLFQGHAAEQVGQAGFEGQGCVLIWQVRHGGEILAIRWWTPCGDVMSRPPLRI